MNKAKNTPINNLEAYQKNQIADRGNDTTNFVAKSNSEEIMPDATFDNLFVNGKAGIGTTNPQAPLHLFSAANPTVMRIQSAGRFGAARIEFWSDPQGSTNEWRPAYIQSTDQGPSTFTGGLAFFVNGAGSGNKTTSMEVMRIVNGSVGIGTTTPNRRLHVQCDEIHSGGAGAGFSFGNRETSEFVNNPSSGERWVWYASGGIAHLWSGSDKVSVNTSGVVSATQFVTSSSREVKKNIAELSAQEALATLENLNPVKFNYKADSDENLHIGFIAEDVPQLVATADRKGLSAMDIVGVLTKALQEQQKTIAALTEKVQRLETQAA